MRTFDAIVAIASSIALLAAVTLRLLRQQRFSGWLLLLLPIFLTALFLLHHLKVGLEILALTLLAAGTVVGFYPWLTPLFWACWIPEALISALLVYFRFFWSLQGF